ncbi:hypothetical protein [Micropruina sp.]|uniref:phage tail tube protein n=1 Tax=Micropruina sp. TaxID=2737536 RepID=UPI0039E7017C
MAIVKDGLIVPKFGAMFTAVENTSPIGVINDFTLLAAPATGGWTHHGHLSRENLPETSSDGGDTSTLSTWLEMNTDSETEESVDTVVYSMLQRDANTLAALTALSGTKVSVFELWMAGTRRFGIWYPSMKAAMTGRPTPNGTDQYSESKLSMTILKPSVSIAAQHNPELGRTGWPNATNPDSLYFDTTAFTGTAAPVIGSALPSGAAVGDSLVLTGVRFTGATGITIKGAAVTKFSVLSPTMISLVVPATVAGASPIIVTTPAGPSPAFAYTAA